MIGGDQTSRLNMLMSRDVVTGAAEVRFGTVDAIKAPATNSEATADPKEV